MRSETQELYLRAEAAAEAGCGPAVLKALWKEAGALGLLDSGTGPPEGRWNGSLQVMRDLGRGGLIDWPLWMQADVLTPMIEKNGTDRQRSILGGMRDGSALVATCLTERRNHSSLSALDSVATEHPKGFSLNAEKLHVTNAVIADWFIVSARLGGSVGLFLVEASAPGIAVEPTPFGTGLELLGTGRVTADDCLLPPDALLGDSALAGFQLMLPLSVERFAIAVMCAEAARKDLHRTVSEAKATGLAERSEIQRAIAEEESALIVLEGLLDQLSASYSAKGVVGTPEAAAAKLTAAEIWMRTLNLRQRLRGASGVLESASPSRGDLESNRRLALAHSLAGGAAHSMLDILWSRLSTRSANVPQL